MVLLIVLCCSCGCEFAPLSWSSWCSVGWTQFENDDGKMMMPPAFRMTRRKVCIMPINTRSPRRVNWRKCNFESSLHTHLMQQKSDIFWLLMVRGEVNKNVKIGFVERPVGAPQESIPRSPRRVNWRKLRFWHFFHTSRRNFFIRFSLAGRPFIWEQIGASTIIMLHVVPLWWWNSRLHLEENRRFSWIFKT